MNAVPLSAFAVFILSGCAATPTSAPPEPGHTSRTIHHPATRSVPYCWTSEILDASTDRLYHGKLTIIPPTATEGPRVIVNDRPQ